MELHKRLFGDYDLELMNRPNAETMPELQGSIQDFLVRNNLLAMDAVFYLFCTLNGQG